MNYIHVCMCACKKNVYANIFVYIIICMGKYRDIKILRLSRFQTSDQTKALMGPQMSNQAYCIINFLIFHMWCCVRLFLKSHIILGRKYIFPYETY